MSERVKQWIALAAIDPKAAEESLKEAGGMEQLDNAEFRSIVELQRSENPNEQAFAVAAVTEYHFPQVEKGSKQYSGNIWSMWKRPSWEEIFMFHAIAAATRHTCLKRSVGAVLVRNKRIIGSGYNGAAAGITSCRELGYCYYDQVAWEEARGDTDRFKVIREEYKLLYCIAVHAEMNAFAQCSADQARGSTLYITNYPCPHCAQDGIITHGVEAVVVWKRYLENIALTMDEKRASQNKLLQAGISVKTLPLSEERITEIAQYMALQIGERSAYKFSPQ